jgi:hypothetical protein
LDTVYESDNAGFREVWAGVVGAMENASTGSTTLETMDAYKIALPVSLASAKLDASITFCSINSRPITFNGLSKDNCSELLSSMLHWLFTFFSACASPENFLVRATTAPPQNIPSENGEQKVALAGGSNMKQCVSPFAATGISVVDICSPGWTPTAGNITMLAEKIKATAIKGLKGIVLDLFGNIVLRFEQFDGSTALPYKSNGSFHLGGKVVCCNTEQFKKIVVSVSPIFQARGNIPCVVMPPMPRFLFVRCCSDTSHCTNANEQNYKETLLTDYIALRTVLIRQLVSLGCKNFKVLDTCCATGCPATSNTPTRIAELKNVTASDGVHFSKAGYSNIVNRCSACLSAMNEC